MGDEKSLLTRVLHDDYGLAVHDLVVAPAGTATRNYLATTDGRRLFVKVYSHSLSRAELLAEGRAVALARFAADAHQPVPAVHHTRVGELLTTGNGLTVSVWDFVENATTAEPGLSGVQWETAGHAVGALHRVLAGHPAAAPTRQPGAHVCDVADAQRRFDELIAAYDSRKVLSPFAAWAREAAVERRTLLPKVADIAGRLPPLTTQVVHGDLAAPNVLFDGDNVAGVVDFRPPVPGFIAWESARLAADPRSILADPNWPQHLARFVAAYRDAYPAAAREDLIHMVAVGTCYTLCSRYPLAEALTGDVDGRLAAYARARHGAALSMLKRLAEAEEVLRDG